MTTFLRRLGLTAMLVSALSVASAAAAATGPLWSNARSVTLPSGATGLTQGYLPALSCPVADSCTAVGAFTDAQNTTQGLVISETSGTWGVPQMLRLPSNAGSNPLTTIYSLDCPTVNHCAAVGSYQDQGGNVQAFVVSQTSSTWPVAQLVTLPGNATSSSQNAQVRYVSCASVGNCSAVGTYLDNNTAYPRTIPFTVDEVNGSWGAAQALALPVNANANPLVTINQVACPSTGNCTAIGSFIDANNVTRAFVANEVTGVWQRAAAVALPSDANAYALSALSELTCTDPGACVAIGTYATASGALEGLTVTESNGVWRRAVTLSMPADAAASPHVFFYGFGGISCATAGNCSAGGQFLDSGHHYQAFVVNEVAGSWQRAVEVSLPTGALQAGKNGGVVAVSCSSAGNCSAGAAYLDGTGRYQALVINDVGGNWLPGKKIALPAGANTVGVAGGVYGLICSSTDACTATGSYLDGSGNYQGFTVTGV